MNVKYTDFSLFGLGKAQRKRLSAVLRACPATISIGESAKIWGISPQKAAKLLSLFASKGWLSRIHPGVYIPIPLQSELADIVPEDPLIIAEELFSPCYIGGWSAAEYWGLTEQIFQTVVVMVQKQKKNYRPVIKNTQYWLRLSSPAAFFGLQEVWRDNVKICLSDPTRTVVDLVSSPILGGGIRIVLEIIQNYFNSKEKSNEKLLEYLRQLNKGAAYKRLGFLLEKYYPEEETLINECRERMTAGNTKLDFALNCNKLVTRWRLWVPENWR